MDHVAEDNASEHGKCKYCPIICSELFSEAKTIKAAFPARQQREFQKWLLFIHISSLLILQIRHSMFANRLKLAVVKKKEPFNPIVIKFSLHVSKQNDGKLL